MQHILKLTPLPLLAALFVACSGAAEPEPAPPVEGDSEQALASGAAGSDVATADKGRRGRGERHRGRRGRGRGHGHGHGHHGPPEPPGESCEVAGQTFPDGAGVPSGDSCNSCGCNDGDVICTLALCEPVVCAEFIEEPDGVCSRFPLDPCQFQDPDCSQGGGDASCEAAGQIFPDGSAVPSGDSCNTCSCNEGSIACTEIGCEPVVCTQALEEPDGVCSRFPLDPCISQDPDCVEGGDASCEAGGQTFPDGADVPSGDSCNTCSCNDGGVACTRVGCEPVVCALFVEEPDGVCSRFPLDPCISQDPDCVEGGGGASCEAAGQTFPDGSSVPSGDSCNSCSCADGSVICTLALCEPVFCALFVEESDGVCSRFPLDPCKSQDPDCIEPEAPAGP